VSGVVVTYPTGEEVGFVRRSDGSFAPPSGRSAALIGFSDGYKPIDKTNTTYLFNHAFPSLTGVYGITSITDAPGRVESFTYTGDQITTVTAASGRALHLTWSTPGGATAAHVTTVVTDPAVAGDSSTALTWSYTYSGDQLTKVCPPTSATACTTY